MKGWQALGNYERVISYEGLTYRNLIRQNMAERKLSAG